MQNLYKLHTTQILVEELDNGYLIDYQSPNGDEGVRIREAFSADDYDDTGKSECEALKKLLWAIVDHTQNYSKHNQWNVSIHLEKDGTIVDE